MSEYSDVDITIYIDPNDSSLLDELKKQDWRKYRNLQ